MYHHFYGLSENPFAPAPDPTYLFLSPSHQEALASIVYGVHERQGFLLILGEVGTGKTTLIRHVLAQEEPTIKVACVFNPTVGFEALLYWVLRDLEVPCESRERFEMIDALHDFLLKEEAAGRQIVLIVDEAQHLSPEVLEEFRMLSNLETARKKLLQILLVGQPELGEKLARPELRQLRQRIGVVAHLQPLSLPETCQYMAHRLQIAGYTGEDLFTRRAFHKIHRASGGIPRLINAICDKSLAVGYAEETSHISGRMVQEVLKDWTVLGMPAGAAEKRWYQRSMLIIFLVLIGIFFLACLAALLPRGDWHLLSTNIVDVTQPTQPLPTSVEPQAGARDVEEAFVAVPRPAAMAPPPVQIIQQVTALANQFFPDGGAFALHVRPDKGTDAVYTAGENLVVDIVAARAAYLQVDYYQADGRVVHLLPNALDSNFVEAGETFTLGKPGSSVQFAIAPPFGREMLTVIASQQPLETPVEILSVEPSSTYFERLARRLEHIQANAKVAVAYTRIRTQAQGDTR